MYEEIIAQNRGLLASLARRYAGMCALDRAVSTEDLTQAGFIGLMRAADSYDPAARKTWASWARWCIQNEFNRALGLHDGRPLRPDTGAQSLDRLLEPSRDGDLSARDRLADETLPGVDAALLLEELRRGVREAVERLPEAGQRQVVRLCKLEGRSYRQAAREMGVSVQKAQRLYARASDRLARDVRLRALWRLSQ